MNKRRLLKLADLLEADAKNKKGIKFDLCVIASKVDVDGDHKEFQRKEIPTVDCGTAACAVGLACISGAFARSGLSYSIDRYWGLTPKFGRKIGWNRAETAFFGLTDNESNFLFTADEYPDGKTFGATGERYVAKRIRDFVAGKVSAA